MRAALILPLFGLGFVALAGRAFAQTPIPVAGADRPLGRLEQESVDEALGELGLTREPNPEGKTIGRIHIVNQEVFSPRDWHFQLLNVFHRTTRPEILRRELLMKPGEPYSRSLVEETMRNLQAPPSLTIGGRRFSPPELSSVVVILPARASRADEVDLVVVTRDIWSLRFNTDFEYQQDTLTFLSTSLSENNLFGWRKYLAMGFTMDQGAMWWGPTYYDPNIRGTRLTLYASAMLYYTRGSHEYEGNRETFSLRRPLYSLGTRWGGGVDLVHQDVVVRGFRGNSLALQDLSTTPETETIPFIYRRRLTTIDTNVVRSSGGAVIHRLTLGHLYDGRRSSLLPDYPYGATAADLDVFLQEYATVSERRSEPYVRYEVFTARYAVYRDLETFDLRENRRLGPALTLRTGYGLPALGAEHAAWSFGGTASYALGAGDLFGDVQLSASARLRDDGLLDQTFVARLQLATPHLARTFRIVASAEINTIRADTFRTRYFLGGDTGLRGYIIGEFQGTSMAVGHLELRTRALPVLSQRFGGVVFYDVGHAAPELAELVLRQNVGAGLRWLIPQLNSSVIRVDWAFPLQDGLLTRAGWPGRVSAGFQQVF